MKTKKVLLGSALFLAANAHAGQFDKGGQPYLLHPLAVMQFLNTDDEELQCIAILHDVLEDTAVTVGELLAIGFTDRVVAGVVALTKLSGQSYEDYKLGVFANVDAMKVKMADLRHNTDIRRLEGVTQKDHDRIAKYHEFYFELQERLA